MDKRVQGFILIIAFVFGAVLATAAAALAELPEKFGYDTVYLNTGDPVNVYLNLRNWENPFLTEGLMFDVRVLQWENGQVVLDQTGLTANFFEFTPVRAGHYVVQARINHPTDGVGTWYDSRQGRHHCADPCIFEEETLRPWLIYAWPRPVGGEGTIE